MAEATDDRPPCARAERSGPRGCDPRSIIDLLAENDAREVYLRASEPVTVRELSETLGLSQSTAYRKVEALEEAGLLTRLNERSQGGVPAHYVRSIDCVSVTYGDPVRIECTLGETTLSCEP